jgi:carbamoyltransferase
MALDNQRQTKMIVVGLGKAHHDSSICAYINGEIKYAKYEREYGVKHAVAPEYWYIKKLSEWGVNKADLTITPDEMDHHLAHAWSNSEFTSESQAFVLDGYGTDGYTSMTYSNGIIHRSKEFSPAICFNYIGVALGFSNGLLNVDNAGKVMGLVPYGKPDWGLFELHKPLLSKILRSLTNKLGINAAINQENIDYIATLNELCFQDVLNRIDTLDKFKPIIYAGGCALNVDWNRRLMDMGYDLRIEPHVYDGGLSIGCMRYGIARLGVNQVQARNFPYIQDDEAPPDKPTVYTITEVARLLAKGKIVGWYQGQGEVGPRALGNRSILMNPTLTDGKDILNSKVKHREWFRPFGASVKADKASEYFDLNHNPYMLFCAKVVDNRLKSVTHIDGTCRHQTVTRDSNPLFYTLLDRFETITGLPVLLNTSLNLGGKPIAGTIAEAVELYETTEMDALCVGNKLYIKGI